MPRRAGRLYRDVVMTASDYLLTRGIASDMVQAPSLKEVYYRLRDGSCLAVKTVERLAPMSPWMLRRYARMFLKHAKESCGGYVKLLMVTAARLTIGALIQAARMKWLRIISKATLGDKVTSILRVTLKEIAWELKRRQRRSSGGNTTTWRSRDGPAPNTPRYTRQPGSGPP